MKGLTWFHQVVLFLTAVGRGLMCADWRVLTDVCLLTRAYWRMLTDACLLACAYWRVLTGACLLTRAYWRVLTDMCLLTCLLMRAYWHVLTDVCLLMQCVHCIHLLTGSGYVCRPDLSAAAHHFIRAFRNGELGRLMLDKQELTSVAS